MKISATPNQHPIKVVDFPRLDGGLNLWELDYRLDNNQTPEMRNLWWQDGVLQCRDGQEYLSAEELGTGYTCAGELFWDNAFFHIGGKLYRMDLATAPTRGETRDLVELCAGVPENRGTFFRYGDWLFYKNRGGFFKIAYDPETEGGFKVTNVQEDAYVPTILLNASPVNGAGSEYQPENRLSPKKTVKYNAAETTVARSALGTGSAKQFDLGLTAAKDYLTRVDSVYFGENTLVSEGAYTADLTTGMVTFTTAPAEGTVITFVVKLGVTTYKLPVSLSGEEEVEETFTGDGAWVEQTLATPAADLKSVTKVTVSGATLARSRYTVDAETGKVTFTEAPAAEAPVVVYLKKYKDDETAAVTKVVVDGAELVEGTDYAVDLRKGQIVFVTPPPVTFPEMNNTVEVTYTKDNPDALQAVMDCRYVAVYGGDQRVCIVMTGSEKQPNAIFWNSNDAVSMNPSYWPMTYYNLAGDTEDAVTGFGRQYSTLIVLKGRSVGKMTYDTEVINNRESISLTYEAINSKIGCDLPWTVQLIENNVVFCNTQGGVYIVRDSSSALENNVECVSRNVNGTAQRPGLLEAVQTAAADGVVAYDDDNRYWLCVDGKVFLWDYLLSTWKNPSWFYFTDVPGIAYLRTVDGSYHLNPEGQVTQFSRVFMDYGGAIDKVYQFPPQFFDSYDRLKDIMHVIFTVRSDTDTVVDILYQSDYEDRHDLTTIDSFSWRLAPRNLKRRCLGVQKFAMVARRKPGCRHIRHFSMRLSNNEEAQDLAILSAQIYFRYLGRDR